ncbi:unnamed protein product [Cochlearia groenlandica]
MAIPIGEIPEDIQLRILSFLTPKEISTFACTSKRFSSLCGQDAKIWHAICDRKWGKKTQIHNWLRLGKITFRLLYKTLIVFDNLIGFWRLCGGGSNPAASSPPLIFFEWSSSFVLGSKVLAVNNDTYRIRKTPFLVMSVSSQGRIESFVDLGSNLGSGFVEFESLKANLVPVDVNFMGNGHIIVEEKSFNHYVMKGTISGGGEEEEEEEEDVVMTTSPSYVVSEIYTQLANKTSPGGDRRRQRKKERERQQGRRIKWEPEHFIKVSDFSPTVAKPLQGLWKGFRDGSNLELYLVKYDEVGGIICKKIEDLALSRHTQPVFWTPNHTFVKSPFSVKEEMILDGRIHISPILREEADENVVSGMLYMNSSSCNNDMLLREEDRVEEGRVWLYENGSFGFGFLRDQFIIDMKRVALEDGCLADVLEA